MKSKDNRELECEKTLKYESKANPDQIHSRRKCEPVRSMSALREEIIIIDKIDSINMKIKMDQAYADLDIDLALRWKKKLTDFSRLVLAKSR